MCRSNRRRPGGFTLLELLVVLAVLVFLLGLFLTAVQKVREAASRAQCQNNLKMLGLAVHNCNGTYNRLPPLVGDFPKAPSPGTVFFHLLPFLDQDNLYKNAGDGKGNFSVWRKNTQAKVVKGFLCPSDASGPDSGVYKNFLATSSYAANFLAFGDPAKNTLNGKARIPQSFPDGTSNTIIFTERFQMCKDSPCAWGYAGTSYWTSMYGYYSEGKFQVAPKPADCDPALAQSPHPGGINVGMCDGSVRFLSQAVSPLTWWLATDPADGQPLGDDF
jgi:prepilin-type N-terminal cleavage/methylation domain-containing protein/prepilin-type processing-associated H-X9-DG protein